MMRFSLGPVSILALSFADDDSLDIARPLKVVGYESRVRAMTGRAKSRCLGLLEVHPGQAVSSVQQEDNHLYESSEVQYLHLSVKEFLEKPDVWTRLLKITAGTEFDAHISLLKAVVIQRDTKSPSMTLKNSLPLDLGAVLVDKAMRYALQAESGTGMAHVSLLDELDPRITKISLSRPTKSISDLGGHIHDVHWSAQLDPSCRHRDTFLKLVILKGLTRYVKVKLGNQAVSINARSNFPLLKYASTYLAEGEDSMQPTKVAMLLEAGMNPNEKRDGSSPWRGLMNLIIEAVLTESQIAASWFDIYVSYMQCTGPLLNPTLGNLQLCKLFKQPLLIYRKIRCRKSSRC